MSLVLEWRQSTRNRYVADVVKGAGVEVYRDPSWRRLEQKHPWRVSVFGNPFTCHIWFLELQGAQAEAERVARMLCEEMAGVWGASE